jgi:hypothetical protein
VVAITICSSSKFSSSELGGIRVKRKASRSATSSGLSGSKIDTLKLFHHMEIRRPTVRIPWNRKVIQALRSITR